MNDSKWVNQFQPQTLVIATFLLYLEAAFWVLNLIQRSFPAEVALLAIVTLALGGYGIANEKKWGYVSAIFGALLNFGWPFLYGISLGNYFSNDPIGFIFTGAIVALLVHPMSREYQRIWFK
ncbi:MAG TPA: hypothetical protein VGA11_04180 [Acidimicrobiia bacterium]